MRRQVAVCALFICAVMFTPFAVQAQGESKVDLLGIKTYLLEKTALLTESAAKLQAASQDYYDLAKAAGFDYEALWAAKHAEVVEALDAARQSWVVASPVYEQMEGIVAGVPSLSEYDVILDAGASAEDDPENAVPFDLKLPDGRILEKPGNLFGLLEVTLWGTRAEFVAKAEIDLDGDGSVEFGEVLPEANMLKGAADLMHTYAAELDEQSKAWQPNETDAFTALVVMVPTMSEYFESWKLSRFVQGDTSQQADFAVISRLSDIQDILSGLEVVYQGVSPLVAGVDTARDKQIAQGLADLRAFVGDLLKQEQGGKRFTPEEADLYGGEAQGRADAIAGQIAQIAAQLNITLPE